jgi:hypothetical protein
MNMMANAANKVSADEDSTTVFHDEDVSRCHVDTISRQARLYEDTIPRQRTRFHDRHSMRVRFRNVTMSIAKSIDELYHLQKVSDVSEQGFWLENAIVVVVA